MASLTNKTLNTGTLTNKALMAETAGLTFDETSPSTFDEMQGTWSLPWSIKNKTLNTGTITNKSASA